MKTKLAITDLTRMANNHVCLAGYTPEMRCVRPTRFDGIPETWLYQDGQVAIRPFAVIACDLIPIPLEPPHTEDQNIALEYRVLEVFPTRRRRAMLEHILDPAVSAIFGAPIFSDQGAHVLRGTGARSLGTVRVATIESIGYTPLINRWDYRMTFTDGSGEWYRLPITDLAWRMYCDYQRDHEGVPPATIALRLESALRRATVFLRIGLSRGWKQAPEKCFVQITGVYTFPDYLGGLSFADFRPRR